MHQQIPKHKVWLKKEKRFLDSQHLFIGQTHAVYLVPDKGIVSEVHDLNDCILVPYSEVSIYPNPRDPDKFYPIYHGDVISGSDTEDYESGLVCTYIGIVIFGEDNLKWIVHDPYSNENIDLCEWEPIDYIKGNVYEDPDILHPVNVRGIPHFKGVHGE